MGCEVGILAGRIVVQLRRVVGFVVLSEGLSGVVIPWLLVRQPCLGRVHGVMVWV